MWNYPGNNRGRGRGRGYGRGYGRVMRAVNNAQIHMQSAQIANQQAQIQRNQALINQQQQQMQPTPNNPYNSGNMYQNQPPQQNNPYNSGNMYQPQQNNPYNSGNMYQQKNNPYNTGNMYQNKPQQMQPMQPMQPMQQQMQKPMQQPMQQNNPYNNTGSMYPNISKQPMQQQQQNNPYNSGNMYQTQQPQQQQFQQQQPMQYQQPQQQQQFQPPPAYNPASQQKEGFASNNTNPPPPSYKQHVQTQPSIKLHQPTIYADMNEMYSKFDDLKLNESSTWDQPRPDAKGCAHFRKDYSMNDARNDAQALRKAMKGFGRDKKAMVEISGNRNHNQRLMIKEAFVTVDGNSKKRNLIGDIRGELGSSNLGKVLIAMYRDVGEYDAELVLDAVQGMGFNSELLIEILCTRTNKQINELKAAWKEKLRKGNLEERIRDETKKFMSGNHFQSLMLKILEANRPNNKKPDQNVVKEDAEVLNRYVTTAKKADCKTKFIEIFTERSWAHIAGIANVYQNISKKYNLQSAIKHAFGDGSDTSNALRVITEFCQQPYDYWAVKLRKSMKGVGTNDDLLRRVIITRSEVDLENVRKVFGQRYGDGKTLKNWIEGDTSGSYEKVLLLLSGY